MLGTDASNMLFDLEVIEDIKVKNLNKTLDLFFCVCYSLGVSNNSEEAYNEGA